MLRIETESDATTTTIRLIGRVRSEHRNELSRQIESGAGLVVLDLSEVTLVDLDVVRFLGKCEVEGIELRHCPLYVREWILRERAERQKH